LIYQLIKHSNIKPSIMAGIEIKPDTTLEDLIFADRNKAYGAYFLRQIYNKTVSRSALIGIAAVAIGLVGPTIYTKLKPKEEKQKIVLANPLDMPPPPVDKDKPEPPPPPPPPPEMPKVSTTKFLPPEIKPDELVPEDVPPPTQKQLAEAPAGQDDVKGDPNAVDVVVDPDAGPKKEEVVEVKPAEPEEVFTVVEQQPEFPGGTSKMYQYLGKNIQYPSAAQRANVTGKVFLAFVVNTDGSIQNVEVIKGIGFGCDEEAVRVVRSMPRWLPGKQSGRPVRVKYTLPVSFTLE
jgi:periplasmic protein TonB